MKVLTTFLILFLSSIGFAQIISINNSAYPQSSLGPEDLIKNVMISSSCSTADNFTFQVSGAPGDLTTKSYGYFKTPPVVLISKEKNNEFSYELSVYSLFTGAVFYNEDFVLTREGLNFFIMSDDPKHEKQITIDTTSWPNGVYIVNVMSITENARTTRTLIVI